MGGVLRRGSAKTKRLVREALRSVGPSPELLVELAALRNQAQSNAVQIDDLVRRMAALSSQFESVVTARDELSAQQIPLSQLNGTVVGLGETVHAHEEELKEIRRKLERFGGSVLDDLALERRLQNIEDHLSTPGSNGGQREGTRREPPDA